MIGNLSPHTRTRAGNDSPGMSCAGCPLVRRLAMVSAVIAVALLLWPSSVALIAAAVAIQLLLLKRHHLTVDGSDQMALVVLLACLLGRIGADAVSARAAVRSWRPS